MTFGTDELFCLALAGRILDLAEQRGDDGDDDATFFEFVNVLLTFDLERGKKSPTIINGVIQLLEFDLGSVFDLETFVLTLDDRVSTKCTGGVLAVIVKRITSHLISFEEMSKLLDNKEKLVHQLKENLRKPSCSSIDDKGIKATLAEAEEEEYDFLKERDFTGAIEEIVKTYDSTLSLANVYKEFGYTHLARQCAVEALGVAHERRMVEDIRKVVDHVDSAARTIHAHSFLDIVNSITETVIYSVDNPATSMVSLALQTMHFEARSPKATDFSELCGGNRKLEGNKELYLKTVEHERFVLNGALEEAKEAEGEMSIMATSLEASLRVSLCCIRRLRESKLLEAAMAACKVIIDMDTSTVLLGDVVKIETRVELIRCLLENGETATLVGMIEDVLSDANNRGLAAFVAELQYIFLFHLYLRDCEDLFSSCKDNIIANVETFGTARVRGETSKLLGAYQLRNIARKKSNGSHDNPNMEEYKVCRKYLIRTIGIFRGINWKRQCEETKSLLNILETTVQ
eukprot:m.32929 g.32929  ORF g.32929 m.32929 type:complete len:517 (-) comp6421_c0_seq3:188-1738(-)